MTYDEMIEILQAAKAGKVIEYESAVDGWKTWPHSGFNFSSLKYRVKPEPKRCWVRFQEGKLSVVAFVPTEGYTEMVEVVR